MSRSFATMDPPDERRPDAEDREPMTVIDWLLDSDPAIRWQVLRDLTDESAEVVATERARVAREGWGARLLALQAPDGRWGGRPWSLDYTDTFHTLELLRLFGLDPRSDEAKQAIGLVRERVIWKGGAPVDTPWDDHRFFEGEVEPCINGNVVATGSYFGVDVTPLVERLLGEQLADGGWNCEVENGATVSSFGTTINVLEGLLLYERANDRPDVTEAHRRGEDYMLERRLFRRKSTGEVIDPEWLRFSFPTWWHYDVLRGLDYLRDAGVAPGDRIAEAISIMERNRDPEGRWPLQNVHEGEAHFEMERGAGTPSRWNTLRALRVLRWWNEGSRFEAAALAAKEA
jgi:hypothetical protein